MKAKGVQTCLSPPLPFICSAFAERFPSFEFCASACGAISGGAIKLKNNKIKLNVQEIAVAATPKHSPEIKK